MKLKITCELNNMDGGFLRYDFRINPLAQNVGIFMFMRYCQDEDIDKKNSQNIRKVIARDLRQKHRDCWARYREWKKKYDAAPGDYR